MTRFGYPSPSVTVQPCAMLEGRKARWGVGSVVDAVAAATAPTRVCRRAGRLEERRKAQAALFSLSLPPFPPVSRHESGRPGKRAYRMT